MKLRGIYRDPAFEKCCEELAPSMQRFDDAFRGIEFLIAVEPYINTTPFTDEHHRIMITTEYPGVPELWVYFRVEPDDNNCTLLWLAVPGLSLGLS